MKKLLFLSIALLFASSVLAQRPFTYDVVRKGASYYAYFYKNPGFDGGLAIHYRINFYSNRTSETRMATILASGSQDRSNGYNENFRIEITSWDVRGGSSSSSSSSSSSRPSSSGSSSGSDSSGASTYHPYSGDRSVNAADVHWAETNVGSRGTFVARPEQFGEYFTFNQAQSACPAGWRTPSYAELESLAIIDGVYTTMNGVSGRSFNTGSQTIFIPAAGVYGRDSKSGTRRYIPGDVGGGFIWGRNGGDVLRMAKAGAFTITQDRADAEYSVRCVTDAPHEPAASPGEIDSSKPSVLATPAVSSSMDGVIINGVTWATRNVGVEGKFMDNSTDYGLYYSIREAQAACPAGWRLPTSEEFDVLRQADGKWTTLNEVNGYIFGSGNNVIFLPAAAGRRGFDANFINMQGKAGIYWTSDTNDDQTGCGVLVFGDDAIFSSFEDRANADYSVRCVRE